MEAHIDVVVEDLGVVGFGPVAGSSLHSLSLTACVDRQTMAPSHCWVIEDRWTNSLIEAVAVAADDLAWHRLVDSAR